MTFTSVCNPPETEGGRLSVVGIAILWGLECLGLETLFGQNFLESYGRALKPTPSPVQWVRGVSPGVKSAGAWP